MLTLIVELPVVYLYLRKEVAKTNKRKLIQTIIIANAITTLSVAPDDFPKPFIQLEFEIMVRLLFLYIYYVQIFNCNSFCVKLYEPFASHFI